MGLCGVCKFELFSFGVGEWEGEGGLLRKNIFEVSVRSVQVSQRADSMTDSMTHVANRPDKKVQAKRRSQGEGLVVLRGCLHRTVGRGCRGWTKLPHP